MKKVLDWLKRYCVRVGWKRFLIVLFGNVLLGLGVGLFRWSNMGVDPFSGMNLAVSARFHFDYPIYQIVLNVILFTVQVIWGYHLIGIGTLINMFLLGHINTFFYWLFGLLFGTPSGILISIIGIVAAVLINCVALSLYQTPNVGVAPWDSLSLIMKDRFKKVSYFVWRLMFDISAVAICLLAGGTPGIGTVICALGLGPIVHLITEHFTLKFVKPMDTTGLYPSRKTK